ncbi:hypothetical protein [Streptomyces bauhiniae]
MLESARLVSAPGVWITATELESPGARITTTKLEPPAGARPASDFVAVLGESEATYGG